MLMRHSHHRVFHRHAFCMHVHHLFAAHYVGNHGFGILHHLFSVLDGHLVDSTCHVHLTKHYQISAVSGHLQGVVDHHVHVVHCHHIRSGHVIHGHFFQYVSDFEHGFAQLMCIVHHRVLAMFLHHGCHLRAIEGINNQ